ncbi:MAG: universal stress protein [Planctomycetales bacterium]|nr:universal stress protein [Planctomycetales bacterium]
MKQFTKILVATDTRLDIHPIIDEAAEVARQNDASLKIVDVVPEIPWTARMMVKDHEDIRKLLGREKQERLDALAGPLRDQGMDVEVRVLWGKTSVEIIREVLRGRHDLVLRVAKGHDSRHKGFFGTTGRRLLRDCPCAVWLVAAADTPEYNHVMGCIDTSTGHKLDAELNNNVYELASTISRQHKARRSIIHAWQIDGEALIDGRVHRDAFERMRQQHHDYVEGVLNEFLRSHDAQASDADILMLKGDPAQVIPSFAEENDVDLIVMGTVARSGLTGMLIGNTAERILDDLKCSVLAVKPDSFVSPIKAGEYVDVSQERLDED